MDTFLQIGLSNALMALFLGLLAAGAGMLRLRPALVHALWLLVLLKLVTPPLFHVALPWLAAGESVSQAQPLEPVPVVEAPEPFLPPPPIVAAGEWELIEFPPTPVEPPDQLEPSREVVIHEPVLDPLYVDTPAAASPPISAPPASSSWWQLAVVAVWLGGALGWFLIAALRVRRFRRLLAFARPAPAGVQALTRQLACQLGLTRCPEVRLIPGPVSPLLWTLDGAPWLLLPTELWDRLQPDQQASLLVHELAHLRRRDHWVRLLELLVSGLYWWHPVVWWARRQLREAEEQCCDAWVVWALPDAARAYADALLETLDFLSEQRALVPSLASAAGNLPLMKRRLTMILNRATPRKLSAVGLK